MDGPPCRAGHCAPCLLRSGVSTHIIGLSGRRCCSDLRPPLGRPATTCTKAHAPVDSGCFPYHRPWAAQAPASGYPVGMLKALVLLLVVAIVLYVARRAWLEVLRLRVGAVPEGVEVPQVAMVPDR